jgi:16S rRNA (uracil1498-N3)-methyltransferase
MQRRRFYAAPDAINGSLVELARDETHHLARVLRLAVGDEAFVFDGCGHEYRCRIFSLDNHRAQLEVIGPLTDSVESPIALTLAQALVKGEKFDFIVQKAAELGVRRIVPLITRYADVKLNDEKSAKRLARWQRIALEALKQSGRRQLIDIAHPMMVAALLESRAPLSAILVFSERGGDSITTALAKAVESQNVIACIGPEGGWSDTELEQFAARGAQAVTLGPRTLRTETAAIVALALIQNARGDLSASSCAP